MTDEQIGRINELYRKSKAEGLTEEEKKEQAGTLFATFRGSMF